MHKLQIQTLNRSSKFRNVHFVEHRSVLTSTYEKKINSSAKRQRSDIVDPYSFRDHVTRVQSRSLAAVFGKFALLATSPPEGVKV